MKVPIRIRLAGMYCGILVAVIAVMELAGYLSVRAAIHAVVDHDLEMRLAGLDDYVPRHLDRFGWADLRDALDIHPAFQPSFLLIRAHAGETLYAGSSMTGLTLGASPEHGFGISNLDGNGLPVRVLSVRRTFGGQVCDMFLGTDLGVATAILRRLWTIVLLSMAPLLLLCGAAGYWMSGRALAPIREIVSAAHSIDSRRLDQRVAVPNTGDEVAELAETLNGMLQRIESGFRRMRDFTANASHELRTPVAIVRATAEVALLRRQPTEAHFQEHLERILRESERNSALLEKMLQLSRLDSGVDGTERDSLDLRQSIAEAVEQAAPLAAAREVALRVEAAEGAIQVFGDREQLRRLWLILLDNAIKYTPPGGRVVAKANVTDAGHPSVHVADSGIGIAAEHQERIFERFYRTDKARSRARGGAGLGLSIAREISLVHAAEIRVESELGCGSDFYVTFPPHVPRPVTGAEQAVPPAFR